MSKFAKQTIRASAAAFSYGQGLALAMDADPLEYLDSENAKRQTSSVKGKGEVKSKEEENKRDALRARSRALDANPKEAQIIEQYDKRQISRSKAFQALKAIGRSTDEIRALLGDTDSDAT